MATSNVVVNVVDVGQGQCTFVEVYNNTGQLAHTLLLDCGTDKASPNTAINLNEIARKVGSMAVPMFDCVIFSHSDKDHISLMKSLLDMFPPEKKPRIGKLIYGGNYGLYAKGKSKFNILTYLLRYGYVHASRVFSPRPNFSGYDRASNSYLDSFWNSPDGQVNLYPVMANVIANDVDYNEDWDFEDYFDYQTKTSESKNRVSIIAQLTFADTCCVICGDATSKTMAEVNSRYPLFDLLRPSIFSNNFMLTMPHHGSRSTGYAVRSTGRASENAKKIVSTFSSIMLHETSTISSFLKHRHPSLELISDFNPPLSQPKIRDPRLQGRNKHFLTAHIDLPVKIGFDGPIQYVNNYLSFETSSNTYATMYALTVPRFDCFFSAFGNQYFPPAGLEPDAGPINQFACWVYNINTSGHYSVQGRPNLPSPAFTAAAVNTESFARTSLKQETKKRQNKARKPVNMKPTLSRLKSI